MLNSIADLIKNILENQNFPTRLPQTLFFLTFVFPFITTQTTTELLNVFASYDESYLDYKLLLLIGTEKII